TTAAYSSVLNAAVATTLGDVDATNDRGTDSTAVTAPDLAVDKRHLAHFVFPQQGTYTLIVTNVGTAATFDTVAVRDTLPAGLSFTSASGAGWVIDATGQIVTAKFGGVIVAGDSAQFTLTVTTSAPSVPFVTNAATVSTAGDPNPANDRDTDRTAVLTPDFSVTKSHAAPFMVGKNASYSINVRNAGSLATYGMYTLIDTLPLGLAYRSHTGAGWTVSVDSSGRHA